jgi:glycosyltransferase involved in cell wall biosynthesis
MNKQSFLVSVIIPAFNAESYILDCLNSIINQTYRNLKIIVVNDGSTDRTKEIIETLNDPRLIIVNQENRGCSVAKNKGLELVEGDYVQYLDVDDILSEDKIEQQVLALSNHKNAIAVCKTIVFKNKIDDTNLEIDTDLIYQGGNNIDFIAKLWGSSGNMGMVQPNAYLVPINIIRKIGKWDETLSPSPDEDGEYFARAIFAASKVIFTEGVNYYRKLEQVHSLSKEKSYQHAIGLFNTIKKKFKPYLIIDYPVFKNLYALQLTNCVYQFGNQYPEIFKLVEKEFICYSLRGYRLRINNLFSLTAHLIGFKNAMFLRKVLKK